MTCETEEGIGSDRKKLKIEKGGKRQLSTQI